MCAGLSDNSCLQDDITATPFGQICLLILAGIAIHVVYLAMNFACCKLLRLNEADYKAVLIMASQKTLPIALSVISFLPAEKFGAQGLLSIPCIVGHLSQLFMDAFITSKWAAAEEERQAVEASKQEAQLATAKVLPCPPCCLRMCPSPSTTREPPKTFPCNLQDSSSNKDGQSPQDTSNLEVHDVLDVEEARISS